MYCSVNEDIKTTLHTNFGTNVIINFSSVQKQIGSVDCGLFAMGFATFLAHGNDPVLLSKH